MRAEERRATARTKPASSSNGASAPSRRGSSSTRATWSARRKVFGGSRGAVSLVAKKPVRLLFPRGTGERVAARIVYTGPAEAAGRRRAPRSRACRSRAGDVQALDLPLYAGEDVGQGDLQRRAVDGLFEFGTGLVRRAFEPHDAA